MSYFQDRYTFRIFNKYSPFSSTFSQIEKQEIVTATVAHIKKMPSIVYRIFYFGSIVFTIFPFIRKILLINRIEILISKLVKTILLLYVSEKLSK